MMTKELRKKIGITSVVAFLAISLVNRLTINHPYIHAAALLLLVGVAFTTTLLYMRHNGPLTQREKMKEFALIGLIAVLLIFVVVSGFSMA